jgi:hypothetical protein
MRSDIRASYRVEWNDDLGYQIEALDEAMKLAFF